MAIPMVCFLTWNRAGLTARNLTALLETTDDFQLYIVDNNSQDDTWDFIQSIQDPRIKCKKRLDLNRGEVYAFNYVLSKRQKDQYFVFVENDVCIKTKNWISKFMEVMNAFPEVGLLGAVRDTFFQEKKISPSLVTRDGVSYHPFHIIIGCCICVRPQVFEHIGYWNEETCGGDSDYSARIGKFTPYKMGFVPTIKISHEQAITCQECLMQNLCSLKKKDDFKTCFDIYSSKYQHGEFAKIVRPKQAAFLQDVASGKRSVYCASIHDPDTIQKQTYYKEWADENFQFFINNGN